MITNAAPRSQTSIERADKEKNMSNGSVKWYNSAKGFGFITSADVGQDVFVHQRALLDVGSTLNDGDRVSFDVVKGKHGVEAANVKVL